MKKTKNKDWIWTVIKLLLLIILNGGTIAWFVLNFVGNGEVDTTIGVIQYDYFQTMELKWRLTTYIVMILGWCASYGLLKLFYKQMITRKENDKTRFEQEKNRINATENSKELANTMSNTIKEILEGKK